MTSEKTVHNKLTKKKKNKRRKLPYKSSEEQTQKYNMKQWQNKKTGKKPENINICESNRYICKSIGQTVN